MRAASEAPRTIAPRLWPASSSAPRSASTSPRRGAAPAARDDRGRVHAHLPRPRSPGRPQVRRIPKPAPSARSLLGERELSLIGDALRVRPEDRTKRLLGRRSTELSDDPCTSSVPTRGPPRPGHRSRRPGPQAARAMTPTARSTAGSRSGARSSKAPSSPPRCSGPPSSSAPCCTPFPSTSATRSAAAATSRTRRPASRSPLGHEVRIAETRPLSKLSPSASWRTWARPPVRARAKSPGRPRSHDARGASAMKGLAGRRGRGLPKGARLDCVDNTGAKIVEIIAVRNWHGTHRRYPRAGIADLIIVSVKKGTPEMRRQVLHAVIVRSRSPIRRRRWHAPPVRGQRRGDHDRDRRDERLPDQRTRGEGGRRAVAADRGRLVDHRVGRGTHASTTSTSSRRQQGALHRRPVRASPPHVGPALARAPRADSIAARAGPQGRHRPHPLRQLRRKRGAGGARSIGATTPSRSTTSPSRPATRS